MTAPGREQIALEVTAAHDELRVARKLLREREYRSVITHSYYATFHAARAVLWSRGHAPKTHKGLLQLFGLHVVKTGEVDEHLKEILHTEHDERNLADYYARASDFESTEAEKLLADAELFVATMAKLIK